MANVEVRLNSEGVKEMLRSPEVAQMCMDSANRALGRLGNGYEVESRTYPERRGAVVKAVTFSARKDNAENNSLLKAVQP